MRCSNSASSAPSVAARTGLVESRPSAAASSGLASLLASCDESGSGVLLGLVESRTSAAARAGLVARTGLVAARTHAAAASIGDGGLRAAAGALRASSRAHLGVAQKAAGAGVVGGFLATAIGVALVSFGESVVHLGKQQTADLAHIFDRTGKAQLLNRADFNKIMRLQTAPLQHRSPSADQSSHAIKDEVRAILRRHGVDLRDAFSAFDRDGDGVISRHEFIEGLRSLELGLSATQMEDVLTLVDKDGDGRIEYSEFVRQFGAPRLENRRSGHDLGTALLRQTDGDLVLEDRAAIEHIMSQLAQETGCFDGESTLCFDFATNLLKRGFGRTERSLPRTAGGV